MRISLEELFIHRQYANYPIYYYFDRKTYTICPADLLEQNQDVPYVRYIPLFQHNNEEMQNEYIQRFMGKKAWMDYKESTFCFEEFMQRNRKWDSWWDFYYKSVCDFARKWCIENHIAFSEV